MLDQSKQDESLIMKIVPISVAMLSNTFLTLINVYHNNNTPNSFFGLNLGTIFSNVLGYLLIISLNIGLGSEISKILTDTQRLRKDEIYRKIAISYQRALVVNFMCCVFFITPILYLSKYILMWYSPLGIRAEVLQTTSNYLFQLAPSIFCYAFFDTTRVYLQAQGVRIAPMLILMCVSVMHYFISDFLINNLQQQGMGAAWAKNITDSCSAILLYIYVKKCKAIRKTWEIQWSMDCIFNWKFHFKVFQKMGITTYIQAIMFAIFSLLGSFLLKNNLRIHICFINWSQVFFVVFLGVKQGIINHVNQDRHPLKEKFISGMIICLILTGVGNFLMIVYKEDVDSFFIVDPLVHVSMGTYLVFILSNIIDSIQICVAGLLKSIDSSNYILFTNALCYTNGLILSFYLGHTLEWDVIGLWVGWSSGLLINLLLCLHRLKGELRESIRKFSMLSEESKQMIEMKPNN